MELEGTGVWLENALKEISASVTTGIELDGEIISGLVSYCEMASPLDAKEYLDNIVGEEAVKSVTQEYLKRRGHVSNGSNRVAASPGFHAYVKPQSDNAPTVMSTKPQGTSRDLLPSSSQKTQIKNETTKSLLSKGASKKKKVGKIISLADATKGSIVFQKGKPCSCQARQHRLVSNCLSCGKIVCEQEGEGPCRFCGALVLREGSSYAGLDEGVSLLTDAETAAKAFAKRLVDYDRNSEARTTVMDDQSDYYELEANSWLSMEEKELLIKKREELEEAERANRSKLVLTFDLLGRKVLLNEDEAGEVLQNRILLQPPDERQEVRVKPNPSLKVQPIFINPGSQKSKEKKGSIGSTIKTGLSLEISGRVQHETNEPVHVL